MAPFATPAELASHLQQDLDLATATLSMDLATGIMQAILGQTITQGPITAVLYVTDPCEKYLTLPQWPAKAVTAVTVGGVAVTDYTATATDLWRHRGWVDGQAYRGEPVAVSVAYTPGYSPIPADIKAGSLFIGGQLYGNPEMLETVSIDDYSATRGTATPLLPLMLADQLRARYGSGAFVTGSR